MKSKETFLLSIILVFALGCSRDDENCIKIESLESATPYLTQPEQAKAEFLFSFNNINYSSLQFVKLIDDSPYINIKCYQFVNGLKVFTESLVYRFAGSGQSVGEPMGELISDINIGSESIMDSKSVVDVFLNKIKTDDPTNSNISGCFLLEFGYYDLNVSSGKLEHDFIKAWKVSKEGSGLPFGFIDDTNGTILYYDNGIRN
jgi:hypothetical protein